jgi:hypothetical protein
MKTKQTKYILEVALRYNDGDIEVRKNTHTNKYEIHVEICGGPGHKTFWDHQGTYSDLNSAMKDLAEIINGNVENDFYE